MQLKKSSNEQVKIKIALQGVSGSGKTYSGLLLAKGLANSDFSKVAVIDSEHGTSNRYSAMGNFNVLKLESPFTAQKYIEAINICETAGMDVLLIDGISSLWYELLDFHSKLIGNSFRNWNKINPQLNAFITRVLESSCHVIATMRSKQGYVLNLKDGKYVPEKVGLKPIMRSGIDFEFDGYFGVMVPPVSVKWCHFERYCNYS